MLTIIAIVLSGLASEPPVFKPLHYLNNLHQTMHYEEKGHKFE